VRARLFDVKRLDNTAGILRVAIVVPKLGFSAVRRNKLKRRLRELTRQHLWPVELPLDVVVRAKRDAYDATFDRLRDDVIRVSTALGGVA
jgi:ribonuclease P protein component